MPIKLCPIATDTYIEFDKGDGVRRLNFSDISGTTWNAARLARAKTALQALLDVRMPITSLPADDPARLADPGLPNFFWDGADIIARPAIIVSVTATGGNPPINVVISRPW